MDESCNDSHTQQPLTQQPLTQQPLTQQPLTQQPAVQTQYNDELSGIGREKTEKLKQISYIQSQKEKLRQAIELLAKGRETDGLVKPLKDELSKLQIERGALETKVHTIVNKNKELSDMQKQTGNIKKHLKEIQADSASDRALIEQLKSKLEELRHEHIQLLTISRDQQTEELEKKVEELNERCEGLRAESRVLQTQLDEGTKTADEEALREQFNKQEQVLKRLRAKKSASSVNAFDTDKSSNGPLTSKRCRCSIF